LSFFNGHYDEHMFHPLLVFADGYLLGARLRPGDVGGATDLRPPLGPLGAHPPPALPAPAPAPPGPRAPAPPPPPPPAAPTRARPPLPERHAAKPQAGPGRRAPSPASPGGLRAPGPARALFYERPLPDPQLAAAPARARDDRAHRAGPERPLRRHQPPRAGR